MFNKQIFKYTSSLNEWNDSFYSFNKNKLNFNLFNNNKTLHKLINSYFNLKKAQNSYDFSKDFFKFNYKSNIIKLFSQFNVNNLYKEFFDKHLSIYIDYSQERKYKLHFWKWRKYYYLTWYYKKRLLNNRRTLKKIFVSQPKIKHSNDNINIVLFIFNRNKDLITKKLKMLTIMSQKKNKYSYLKETININKYDITDLKNVIKNLINYRNIYFLLKRNYIANIYLNVFKYNAINLINLKNIINKIYLKKIYLNITNIKYIYLDNTLLIESLIRKLNDRKKKLLRAIKKLFKLIKLAKRENFEEIKWMFKNNNDENNINIFNKDYSYVYKNIMKYLKNKHVIGIFIRAQGRLTRRITASRAVYKLKHKGNLVNYSYLHNRSGILLRGHNKANVISNIKNSYNKNGSYGIYSRMNVH